VAVSRFGHQGKPRQEVVGADVNLWTSERRALTSTPWDIETFIKIDWKIGWTFLSERDSLVKEKLCPSFCTTRKATRIQADSISYSEGVSG
jgi:hypothetical protein